MSRKAENLPQAPVSTCGYVPREGRTVAGVDVGRLAGCAAQTAADVAVAAAMAKLPAPASEALRAVPPITFTNRSK
jgi:hypothetical protein